jgi:hypothetical protein
MTYQRFNGAVRQVKMTGHPTDGQTSQILLVGEDNPQSSADEHALFPYPPNCAGERLCNRIFALPWTSEYLSMWRVNLCNPGWSDRVAGRRAWELLDQDAPWTKLVLLGRKVAGIFQPIANNRELEPFSISRIDTGHRTFTVASLPHPSGRCREWNDHKNYERARGVMRALAPDITWGAS